MFFFFFFWLVVLEKWHIKNNRENEKWFQWKRSNVAIVTRNDTKERKKKRIFGVFENWQGVVHYFWVEQKQKCVKKKICNILRNGAIVCGFFILAEWFEVNTIRKYFFFFLLSFAFDHSYVWVCACITSSDIFVLSVNVNKIRVTQARTLEEENQPERKFTHVSVENKMRKTRKRFAALKKKWHAKYR